MIKGFYMNFFEQLNFVFNTKLLSSQDGIEPVIESNITLHPESKVLLISGMNASGKSVIGKIFEENCKKNEIPIRSCSMRNRTSGLFGQRIIFGDESDSSTGYNSFSSAISGLKSTFGSETPSLMILDEPDIGLSEEYAGALGEYFAQLLNESVPKTQGIVIISHSKHMFKRFLEAYKNPVSKSYIGRKEVSFDEWLYKENARLSVADLLGIKEKQNSMYSKIEKRLNKKD